jgi:2-polyprenyl-3-methyl-5-hydroxy-6-metoxy-1,4-benzoquinol methylase
MFGPNTYIDYPTSISFSHRDKQFIEVYKELKETFSEKFNLQDYDILFIGGSGTTAIESVVWSTLNDIEVSGVGGVFRNKWERLVKTYGKEGSSKYYRDILFCQLETSNSSCYEEIVSRWNGSIVDAISSFPYYDIPKGVNIFVTCVNKQLGGFPGLSIVGVKKSFWNRLKDSDEFTYLNLRRYHEYGLKNQTPTTTPTQIYEHFLHRLKNLDIDELRKKINKNSELIVNTIGKENTIGDSPCPVITIPKKNIPEVLARKWNLYGLQTDSKNYQIFTYSCDDEDYKKFCNDYTTHQTHSGYYKNPTDIHNQEIKLSWSDKWSAPFYPYIEEKFDKKNTKILDVGCGDGSFLRGLHSKGYKDLTGVDFTTIDLSISSGDINYISSFADNLPFKDNEIDLLTSSEMLEHIHEDNIHDVLKEFKRVCNGTLLLTCSHRYSGESHEGKNLHFLVRDKSWWETTLSKYFVVLDSTTYSSSKQSSRFVLRSK